MQPRRRSLARGPADGFDFAGGPARQLRGRGFPFPFTARDPQSYGTQGADVQ